MNFSKIEQYLGEGRKSQHDFTTKYIDKLTFRLDDVVLDVGCGSGDETKLIATKVRSITGIDTSDEMLVLAQNHHSLPNITYCKGDAQTVGDNPDWQERFDKVVSFHVLHWVSDKKEALRSILACLKPGGDGIFIMCNRSQLDEDVETFLRHHPVWGHYVKDFKIKHVIQKMTEVEYLQMFQECGWTDVHCELTDHDGMSINEQQTKLYMNTTIEQSSLIPVKEQNSYLNDLWNWVLEKYPDRMHNKCFNLPVDMAVIQARKKYTYWTPRTVDVEICHVE